MNSSANRTVLVALLVFLVSAGFVFFAAEARKNSGQSPNRSRARNRATPTPTPIPTPRHVLPKRVTGARGFDQFAGRDASPRLIAGGATRGVDPASVAYQDGEVDYAGGKFPEAVEAFTEAAKLKPGWAEAHYALGLSLNEAGKLEAAIAEFQRVVKLKAAYELMVLSHYNIGNNYLDLKKYQEAIDAYKQSIELNPDLSKPHNNLGLAYAALDRVAEAAAEFERAVQLRPDYPEARYNLGVAYLQLGKKSEAQQQQQALTKLDQDLALRLDKLIKQ